MDNKDEFKYEIHYTKVADKFFASHENVRVQYKAAIKELLVGEHPKNIDVKRIKGKKNDYYRIKFCNYRVVYTIIRNKIVVIKTMLAGARNDVYKKMGGMKLL